MQRNRIIYAIVLVGSTFLVSFRGGTFTYAFFYLSLLIPVVSLSYTFYVYKRLQFYQTTPKRVVVKGEVLPYEVTFQNHDRIPYTNIKAHFYEENSEVAASQTMKEYDLLPGDEKKLESQLQCFYRGNYEVGVKNIEVTDFLNLIKVTYSAEWPLRLTVLPRVVKLNSLGIAASEEDPKSTRFVIGSGSQMESLENQMRVYQPGDTFRTVHWKASAKKGELLVRQPNYLIKRENILLLDLSPTGEEGVMKLGIEDKMLEIVLAITQYYVDQRIRSSIFFLQSELKEYVIQNEADFGVFYEKCVSLYFNEEVEIEQLLMAQFMKRGDLGFYIVITHYLSESLLQVGNEMIGKGGQMAVLLVSDVLSEETRTRLEKMTMLGMKVHQIKSKDLLEDVLS